MIKKRMSIMFAVYLLAVFLLITAVFQVTLSTQSLAADVKLAKAAWGTPVVDAEVDEAWEAATAISDFYQSGALIMKRETDIKPSVRMLWDDKALYVLAEVKDDKVGGTAVPADDLSNNDMVEIYIDQNNEKTKTYQEDDICIKVDYQGTYVNVQNAPEDVAYCSRVVSDGYIIELSVPWSRLEPQPGTVVGFDVEISDNTSGGRVRATWILWNDDSNEAYMSPAVFGNLELVGREAENAANLTENIKADNVATNNASSDSIATNNASAAGNTSIAPVAIIAAAAVIVVLVVGTAVLIGRSRRSRSKKNNV